MRGEPTKPLSDRELEILYLAAEGLPDKEIALRLGISAGSIRTYWDRVRTKTGAASRTEVLAKVLAQHHQQAIQELRYTELRLGLVIDAIDDLAVFTIDPHGTILNWNHGVRNVLGFDEQEFVGKPFSIIFSEADVEQGIPERELEKAIEVGRHHDYQWHMRKGGDLIYAAGYTYAIKNDDGDVEFFAKVMRDVTREKQLQDDYDELRLKLAGLKSQ